MLQESTILLKRGRFLVKIADTMGELESALRLRFTVFNLELGEGLPASFESSLDRDPYDDYCDHLIVVDTDTDRIVGTYRLLPGFVAEHNRGYYSETEFDIANIRALPGEKLELGRSCVETGYRSANIISLLWAGIARYVEVYRIAYLFGCVSLHTNDPWTVSLMYAYLSRRCGADPSCEVFPHIPFDGLSYIAFGDEAAALGELPPLVKGYVNTGALLCGIPAYDPAFGTTDLFVLLRTDRLVGKYRKKFFPEAAGVLCGA